MTTSASWSGCCSISLPCVRHGERRACANETYWSAGADGDGVVTVTVECGAYPGPDCRFRAEFSLPWGMTGATVQWANSLHHEGDHDLVPSLLALAGAEGKTAPQSGPEATS